MAIIRDFIDNSFYNPIVNVEAPREYNVHYSDVGTRLEAYIVRVTYKNGRRREFCFAIDNDHWHIVPEVTAYNRALRFYSRKFTKMLLSNENTK